MTSFPQALVIGSGACAREVAGQLRARDIGVVLAAPPGATAHGASVSTHDTHIEVLEGARLIDCQGRPGAFAVRFDRDGTWRCVQAAAIVVAEETLCTPNFAAYGLQPSRRVMALSELEGHLREAPLNDLIEPQAHVVFLNAWHVDSHPVIAARMLTHCLLLQNGGCRAVYLTGNLKVAADGMEACYQHAKTAGATFMKFTERTPVIETLPDGRIGIDFQDDATRMHLRLTADYVVVDETIQPSPSLAQLARVMRLECDASGYLQSDNVHRLSNSTNRRGIFVAGGARAIAAETQQRDDAATVALKMAEFISGEGAEVHPGVDIDQERCARCLTCYRLCPHAAVETAPRMTIAAQSCQGCGVCSAGCPNLAITVNDPDLQAALQTLRQADASAAGRAGNPKLAIFCCRRSASQARDMAIHMGHRLPHGLLFVEGLCSGTFSVNHFLSAFDAGIDGVLVLGCHTGNCHSEHGTGHARKRAVEAAKALTAAGLEAERIACHTLSANMGTEFVRVVIDFMEQIDRLK